MQRQTRNAVTVIGTVVVLFAVILAFVLLNPRILIPPGPGVGIGTGQFAPAFTARDVNGTEWNLSLHRGQIVLIDFMGARCTSCAVEMSAGGLQDLYSRYSARGFTILSIDMGVAFGGLGAQTPEEAWRFVRGLNTDGSRRWTAGEWPVVLDTQNLGSIYGVTELPIKYLLDAYGKIVWKQKGYGGSDGTSALEAQITALIG